MMRVSAILLEPAWASYHPSVQESVVSMVASRALHHRPHGRLEKAQSLSGALRRSTWCWAQQNGWRPRQKLFANTPAVIV